MAKTSYVTLAYESRHLRGLSASANAGIGVGVQDLHDAQVKALNKVNAWILQIAGAKRGAEIVAEFTLDGTVVDALVVDLADLVASAYVWEWWETRNYRTAAPGERPEVPRYQRLQEEAVKLARGIERSGKTLKADGTTRRWRYAALEQGPIVGGPSTYGSHFNDLGYVNHPDLGYLPTPHRNPLLDAT